MKILFYFFLIITVNNNFTSQNVSFNIYNDSISPYLKDNYFKAKKKLIQTERKYILDPALKLLFLSYSLENQDVFYFKKSIKSLMKNNGYTNDKGYFLGQYIENEEISEWLVKKSKKLNVVWIKNNYDAFKVKLVIDNLHTKDQMRGSFYYLNKSDTACGKSAKKELQKIDYANFTRIIKLAQSNEGILPNHIDHGIGTFYIWQGVLFHNLTRDKIEENWKLILPYIEKTYFEGKIGDNLFRLYDQLLYSYFGYQYYGFEKNAPVKDEEHLEDRKLKYRFI